MHRIYEIHARIRSGSLPKVTILDDWGNKLEVRFEVGRLEEVMRWVLSFGSQAKVLSPPELAKMIRREVSEMQNT